ncbi:MAG: helicase-exonuclease AddAB subunit AddA [Lachnospiraceae bacterium]|nr:helicase-exonuclease AddAB subunit AddA [Lachnospiraceae bacterium]
MSKWTTAQQEVIDTRNASLLVSAAAGSGKTAVLVQRIIDQVTGVKGNPVDIDRILVVTFTRAAAKEMKERVYKSLKEYCRLHPGDVRMQRQKTLVHSAHICTIDSFCQDVVRSHFHEIDVDPQARIADEGELKLLSEEVLQALLEEEYEAGSPEFLALIDAFSKKDRDDQVMSMITRIEGEAMAAPWPDQYLEHLLTGYEGDSIEELEELPWMQELVKSMCDLAADLGKTSRMLTAELINEEVKGKPHPYLEALGEDQNFFDALSEAKGYGQLYNIVSSHTKWARFKTTRGFSEEEKELANSIRTRRDAYKKIAEDEITKVAVIPPEQVVEEAKRVLPFAREVVRLTGKYIENFSKRKQEKNILSFSDLEHKALQVLVRPEDNRPTSQGLAYREQFEEIMVDEYQDSNELQELLLSSITRDEKNYFMVGDVKQSIYRFRQACPDIFLGKCRRYKNAKGELFRRIDLDQNFRSRQDVIRPVNDIFRMIMKEDLGGVEYDSVAELKHGATWVPDPVPSTSCQLETILIPSKDEELLEAAEGGKAEEIEALVMASKIRSMMGNMEVYDKELEQMRPITYNDIVILHRSANSISEGMIRTLASRGIPARSISNKGYFSSVEIQTVLSALKIIDNPRQDIPMAAVLHSPMVGLSEDALGRIAAAHMEIGFADAVLAEKENMAAELFGEERDKLTAFFERLSYYRSHVADTPIFELLQQILTQSGYLTYVSGLTGGVRKRGNLEMLLEKAIAFQNSSYQGIFHFLAYIDKLCTYEVDNGEADDTTGEEAVRIMTIHKSKGLEFPVVFVAGCGKGFQFDASSVSMDRKLGMAMSLIDANRRVKTKTLYQKAIDGANKTAQLGEELRVYYVALTRARDKLILVGSEKKVEKYEASFYYPSGALSLVERRKATSFYDYAIPALKSCGYPITIPEAEQLVEEEVKGQLKELDRKTFLEEMADLPATQKVVELLGRYHSVYPYEAAVRTKMKYSVSEIKHRAMEELEKAMTEDAKALSYDAGEDLPRETESWEIESREIESQETESQEKEPFAATLPRFLGGETVENQPALRGTAMHRYLEKLDFSKEHLEDSFEQQLQYELSRGFLTEEQAGLLQVPKLLNFMKSDLAKRMHRADRLGRLYREQAFVMGDDPDVFLQEVAGNPDLDVKDQVIVQGIMDAFFVEEDHIVLVDYKTDFVKTEKQLHDRYRKQMVLYKMALERSFELPVTEIYLYSFALGKCVSVS